MAPIGETSLTALISTLTLTLSPTTYVFLTIPTTQFKPPYPFPLESAIMTFREADSEGITIIAPLENARKYHQFPYQYECRLITCAVHSSLEAVGFLAVLTRELAESGISCNPVSAFYHDHLFVPVGREKDAVALLEGVVTRARKELDADGEK
ncbi:hypothetical protein LTR84_009500 [Exophiala bonariae]|uniref:DUF2241 domain-containing protein n=1 Tax=Exophiala bonariae TaxID=1690606 RepID=A0AAV9MUU1_9EURO|nr:hypothetical protein LTR84_009500 [Exophiala bonariae]